MFAVRILGNDYLIADGVGVVFALGIFPLVVLTDKLLLSVFNVLPVGFEANVVNRIAIEHKLRRRGSLEPPSAGRGGLPAWVALPPIRRGPRGGADHVGLRLPPSPSHAPDGAHGLPGAARVEPARPAGALPFLPPPTAPRPGRPVVFERRGAPRAPAGGSRTTFRSKRRTTSDRLSSCPDFSSRNACASSASSLRLICCHLSDITTFSKTTARRPIGSKATCSNANCRGSTLTALFEGSDHIRNPVASAELCAGGESRSDRGAPSETEH